LKHPTQFDEAIRQLQCLEKELRRDTTTTKSALAYIRERRSDASDSALIAGFIETL
jgi:hypothetical protein